MKICSTCFATSQFPGADIDESGQCQWCRSETGRNIHEEALDIKYAELKDVADTIKKERTGKYDCIIGVSGGLDSSYMAYVAGKLMGLNALLVHYDHGFYYERPKENLNALAQSLGLELRVYKSSKGWDKHYVRAILKAFSKSELFWGICTFCHYILPATIVKVGMAEGIKYYISHSNKYELSMRVPRQTKIEAMLRSHLESGIHHLPSTMFNLSLAQYYLFRLKMEFFVPPVKNIFRGAPRKPFKTINLTKYVPWNIDRMITDLIRDTGWKLPDHPSLGMRFDCMIEDSLMNLSYKKATSLTVHGIIANNLIYDGVKNKDNLSVINDHYNSIIKNRYEEIKKRAAE